MAQQKLVIGTPVTLHSPDDRHTIDVAHWRCCVCHTHNALTRDTRLRPSTHPINPSRCALCRNPPCSHCTLSRPVAADGTTSTALLPYHPTARDHRGFVCPFCGTATITDSRSWFMDNQMRERCGDVGSARAPRRALSPFARRRKCVLLDKFLARCGDPACRRRVADEFLEFYVPRTPGWKGTTFSEGVDVVLRWWWAVRGVRMPVWGERVPSAVIMMAVVVLAQLLGWGLCWLHSLVE